MADQESKSFLGDLLIGSSAIALGVFPALASFDIGPLRTSDIHGPWRMEVAAGWPFIAAGCAVLAPKSAKTFRSLMALLIIADLAAMGNWIAFGVGERACTAGSASTTTDGGIALSGLACRIPFGFGAVVLDALLVYGLARVLQGLAGGPPRLAKLPRWTENLILLSLSPVFLVILVPLILRVGFGVVATRISTGAWPRNEGFIQRQKAEGLLNRYRNK